jgi:hypothetical protein
MMKPAGKYAVRLRSWAPVALVLVAFALYTLGLGQKSLWIDEADSVYFAQHTWSDVLWRLCDPHPPGYYALLKAAMALAGVGEFAVRIPSVLAGILAVATVARLGRELKALSGLVGVDSSWVWLSTALLAVAPLQVWYAQEARMYAFVALTGLGSAVFLVRLGRRWRWDDAVGYVVIAAVALWMDQTALAPLAVANIGFWAIKGWQQREHLAHVSPEGRLAFSVPSSWWHSIKTDFWRLLAAWSALQGVVIAAFWVWWHRSPYTGHVNTETLYPLTMARLTLTRWQASLTAGTSGALLIPVAGVVGVGGILGVGWFYLLRKRRLRLSVPTRLEWLVFLAWCAGTVLSLVPRLYTVKRLAFGLLPFALLLAGWTMTRLFSKNRHLFVPAVLGFSLVMSLLNVIYIPKPSWHDVTQTFSSSVQAGDVIWVDEIVVPVFDYYIAGDYERHVLRVDALAEVAASRPESGRLWLVVGSRRYRDILAYLPNLGDEGLVVVDVRPDVEIRAYDVAQMAPAALVPADYIPGWVINWPSPLHESCSGP